MIQSMLMWQAAVGEWENAVRLAKILYTLYDFTFINLVWFVHLSTTLDETVHYLDMSSLTGCRQRCYTVLQKAQKDIIHLNTSLKLCLVKAAMISMHFNECCALMYLYVLFDLMRFAMQKNNIYCMFRSIHPHQVLINTTTGNETCNLDTQSHIT